MRTDYERIIAETFIFRKESSEVQPTLIKIKAHLYTQTTIGIVWNDDLKLVELT